MRNPDELDLFAVAPLPIAPLDDVQRLACLRLIRSENVGPVTFRALINHYGGASEALAALPEIGARTGRGRAMRIHAADAAEAEIEAAGQAGVNLLFTIEPGYPAALAFTEGAPPMLYVKGRTELLNRPAIALVGSRQSSAAGVQLARRFAAGFGEAGFVVVSGLARGIDGAAHEAALATGTVAVVAGGLDVVYPPEHRDLHAAIAEQGCLVAEMPLAFRPRGQDFPRRNRIISGIARAVVVVEAAKRSGSLITARMANEQGREVFAVPGHPLDPRAEGTNQLLKDGAGLATSAEDVLEALANQLEGPGFAARRAPSLEAPHDVEFAAAVAVQAMKVVAPTLPAARAVLLQPGLSAGAAVTEVARVLGPAPVSFDEVGRATGLSSRQVQAALMELALGGLVEFHGAQLVSIKTAG